MDTMERRKLDLMVARTVMGFSHESSEWCQEHHAYVYMGRDFCPSTNIADAFAMEAEIERRELRNQYLDTLLELVSPEAHIFNSAIECGWHDADGWDVMWAMTHATAEQRCQAALKAIEVVGVRAAGGESETAQNGSGDSKNREAYSE